MSLEAGTSGISKFCFFSETSFSCLWVTGYASTLKAHVRVQWVISPLSFHAHFVLACKGWPVLAFCTLQDRSENLTVNSPMLSTTKPRGWWNFMSECVYICAGYPKLSRELKNSKIQNLQRSGFELSTSWLSVSNKRLNHLTTSALNMKSKSESINLNRHHLVSRWDVNVQNDYSTFLLWLHFYPENPKISNTFLRSENLY